MRENNLNRHAPRSGHPVFQSPCGWIATLWNTGSSAFADDDGFDAYFAASSTET